MRKSNKPVVFQSRAAASQYINLRKIRIDGVTLVPFYVQSMGLAKTDYCYLIQCIDTKSGKLIGNLASDYTSTREGPGF